jgi:hypothetical protein
MIPLWLVVGVEGLHPQLNQLYQHQSQLSLVE